MSEIIRDKIKEMSKSNCTTCGQPTVFDDKNKWMWRHILSGSYADGVLPGTPADGIIDTVSGAQPITTGHCKEKVDSVPTIAPEHLESGANTYRERNKTYGDSYHQFGHVMRTLFPKGLTIDGSMNWNRMGVITQIVSKLCRYSNDFSHPHKDSIHDIMVYAAMLLELDDEYTRAIRSGDEEAHP